ncbi:MAG TPA: PAS domain S-box protein, partial [Coleofasciculaceae cyanobacterium]
KQECQQIEAERSRLIAIVEASADYIATATSDGNILWNNPQLKKIRGLNPEGSVTHLKIADYHPLWAVEMIQQQGISAAIQHGVWVGETALLDEHGQEIPVSQMIVAHKSADGTVDYLSTVMRDISDKRRAEQHIRFQSRLLDAVEQAVIATDLQGNITYWNRFAEVLYGWKAEEVLGHFILDITPASMAQAEATEIFSHLQVGERWSGEFLVQRRDGTIFPIMITDAPIYDENGVLSGIVGISMDMTKLKQAERALRESEQLFRQLAENIRDIFFVYSADLQLLYVSPAYEELWGESREYRYAHPDAWLDQIHSEDRDRIIGILPQINQHNLTYEYRILRQDSQERWIRTRTFLVNDESGNLHRIVGISEDCTERKQLELALQQSEKRFRSAFETAAVGMCLVSPEGRCLDANRSVCQLLGYSKQELLTLTWREITYPEDVETDLKLAQQLWDGEISSYQLEKRYLHKRGQIIWGLLSVSLIRDLRQNPLYFIGQLQDISDRKAAELSLRTVSDRLQYLLTASPAVIFSSPTHGDYTATFISPNVSSILGYEAQNFRESSKFWAMRVHPDDLERITSSFPKIFEQGSCSYEYRFLHADGTYHWLSSQLRLVQDELGNPLEFVGYMIDISDKKRTEEKLRETQQHLQAILDYSPAAIYVIDRDNKHLLVNRCYETLVSMTPEKIIGKTIYEVWPTEFCDAFAINNQQILQSGEPMEFEEVAPHADGMHTYITIKFPLYNTNGDAYAVCGISADITERKQAEEELRTSQRFIQKIADSSPNLLYLYDLEEQRNIYVNRRITQMLGYTPEEVQAMGNQLFPTLMHPDDLRVAPEKQRQMAAACDGDVIDFEYRLRHKNGEWRWLYSWDTPFARNADGKPTQILGTATDISDRKQLELALQQSEERFRTCVENLLDGLALFSSIRDATGQILDFRFEYINPAGCKANRTPREETLGRTLCELLPAHRDTGIFDAYCQVVETGESLIQEAALFEDIYGGERMQRFFDFQAIKLGDGFMVTWRD